KSPRKGDVSDALVAHAGIAQIFPARPQPAFSDPFGNRFAVPGKEAMQVTQRNPGIGGNLRGTERRIAKLSFDKGVAAAYQAAWRGKRAWSSAAEAPGQYLKKGVDSGSLLFGVRRKSLIVERSCQAIQCNSRSDFPTDTPHQGRPA